MVDLTVRKTPLPWWAAGLLLGLVQVLAVGISKPLGVSTQFVIVESIAIHSVAPEYATAHPILKQEKYQKFGYGWWLDIGLLAGALVAAVATRQWKVSNAPVWWEANHGASYGKRFLVAFGGGFLILMGARMAHGCTSGAFASGWAQLSLSAVPMTLSMFVCGMLAARVLYPQTPAMEE